MNQNNDKDDLIDINSIEIKRFHETPLDWSSRIDIGSINDVRKWFYASVC